MPERQVAPTLMLTREPVPEGWHEALAEQCRAKGIEVATNEYGTPVSVHWCQAGQHRYTVCPPTPNPTTDCMVGDCVSYDPSYDASVFFAPDDPTLIE